MKLFLLGLALGATILWLDSFLFSPIPKERTRKRAKLNLWWWRTKDYKEPSEIDMDGPLGRGRP